MNDLQESDLEEANVYFDRLDKIFGEDDWRVGHVIDVYDQITAEEDPLSVRIGQFYLRWALSHPDRLGEEQTDVCVCIDGWVPTGNGTVRACGKCRREHYEKPTTL